MAANESSALAQKIAEYVKAHWPVSVKQICCYLRENNPDLSDKSITDALYQLTQDEIIWTQVNAKEHAKSIVMPRASRR